MGEDAAERRSLKKRPDLGRVLYSDTFTAVAEFYKLKHADAFDDLTEELVALACRDQEGDEHRPFSDPVAALSSSRRSDGHKLALRIRKNAVQARLAIDAIEEDLRRFDAIVNLHPPLLEAIYDVDMSVARNLTVPAAIASLMTFFEEANFDEAAEALARLAAMPIRDRLDKGPMPNVTLQRAVAACRQYWRETEGHSWSMSSLKVKSVRDENNAQHLQGPCEAFVSDVLTQCGMVYGLHDLCNAWTAVDKA